MDINYCKRLSNIISKLSEKENVMLSLKKPIDSLKKKINKTMESETKNPVLQTPTQKFLTQMMKLLPNQET